MLSPNMEASVCGIDIERFHPAARSDQLRRMMQLAGRFTFLHVGRLTAQKNVSRIIDAFREAKSRISDRSPLLIIAGIGPESDRLRADTSGDTDIRFLGYLDRNAMLPALYASSDALVYADETKRVPIVIAEAMASGLPVIAAPVGGARINLRHLVNGLACQPGDRSDLAAAMVRIACDPTLKRQLSAAARSWIELGQWQVEHRTAYSAYHDTSVSASTL